MTQQSLLFNLGTGRARQSAGQRLAATHRAALLHKARAIAVRVAQHRADRCACADDVYRHLNPTDSARLGNAAGSLFHGPHWIFTGRWMSSRRITNNARDIKVWKLR
tara:strand:- start:1363 stop:1683 length:321 start_codon:yes stop_codon:yes gene_type:complete